MILTPHVGGSTEEAQQDIGRFVAGKLRRLRRRPATTSLSASTCRRSRCTDRPARTGSRTLHHNVPGVLATVNALLAEHGVNVEGQVLATRGDLGYVVTDVNADYTPEIVERLEQMPETIRLRVLS